MMHSSLIRICGIILFAFVVAISAKGVGSKFQQTTKIVRTSVTPPPLNINDETCDEEQKDDKKSKVIKINVGGEIFLFNQNIVTRVSGSKFASMINGNCEDIPALDFDGNIFLDYNPTVFRHFIEQLRIVKDEDTPVFYPPQSRLLIPAFNQMMEELDLQIAPVSDDDIITLNVRGEIFVTRRRVLTRISHSQLAMIVSSYQTIHTDANGCVFLDYDARLFRHLLSQLRSSTCETVCKFHAPSTDDAEAFNAMLIGLGLFDLTRTTTTSPSTGSSSVSLNAKITASNYCNAQKTSCAPHVSIHEKLKDIFYANRSTDNCWNSRGYAPQYIRLELEREQTVSRIRLQVSQTPDGQTSHTLLAGSQVDELKEVRALNGFTKNNEWINLTFNPPLRNVRFLHLNTLSSPSWIAWFKILVYRN